MFRNTVLTGLAATIAAMAIAAPAHAQEVIAPGQPSTPAAPMVPPAQPSTPTGTPTDPTVPPAQPSGPTAGATLRFENCHVARSKHGYTYATCTVVADHVPFGQTVSVGYHSSLKTFKPRTHVKWGEHDRHHRAAQHGSAGPVHGRARHRHRRRQAGVPRQVGLPGPPRADGGLDRQRHRGGPAADRQHHRALS